MVVQVFLSLLLHFSVRDLCLILRFSNVRIIEFGWNLKVTFESLAQHRPFEEEPQAIISDKGWSDDEGNTALRVCVRI